jgi:hypothetical protein
MYLAYFDESGDSGVENSPTSFFVLACLLIKEVDWVTALDKLVAMRSQLRKQFNLPTRQEMKAKHFRSGRGVLDVLGWSRSQRLQLFRKLLRFQSQSVPARVFAVAVRKRTAALKGWEPRQAAWTFALQRVQRFCDEMGEMAMLFPDDGHGAFIRRRIRAMRRYHSVPSFYNAAPRRMETKRIIEDPNERRSQDSYFIQMVDWAAYAAHRSRYVDPVRSVPDDLWDELDAILVHDVNKLKGGPPGIVYYPSDEGRLSAP